MFKIMLHNDFEHLLLMLIHIVNIPFLSKRAFDILIFNPSLTQY